MREDEIFQQDREIESLKNENIAYAENLNANLDDLLRQWSDFYYEKHGVGKSKPEFIKIMQEALQWYIDDLLGKIEGDRWERYNKGTWIENKYKELLSFDKTPKQIVIIKKVGARAKVFSLLGKILGK